MNIKNMALCLALLSAFQNYATMVNHGTIDQTNMTVAEPLKNNGTMTIGDTLSLYDTTENNGVIDTNTMFVNGNLKNMAKGSLTTLTMFVAASCNLIENQGAFNINQLYLPAVGTRLKLKLNQRTVIRGLYRGDDYLGGLSFEPYNSSGTKVTITITDESGKKHTFTDTPQNLEKILEKALNEKATATALVAYLRSMTKKS